MAVEYGCVVWWLAKSYDHFIFYYEQQHCTNSVDSARRIDHPYTEEQERLQVACYDCFSGSTIESIMTRSFALLFPSPPGADNLTCTRSVRDVGIFLPQ